MSNEMVNLNLARKWRPKTFDSIVGQEIPVRMLKNSLFLKKFFPVYLFAGQRGCGKTTTARVFAGAVNCHMLDQFQKDPSIQIPCLSCSSCLSMAKGNHPDFIEMDAASHTGVDNVRTIVESSSYLPLNGQKKIYLIDEAHMLSKAAFNAFLKILEEPPASVVFILATTEIQKIPTTVLSRCFQALFTSLPPQNLKAHLASVCEKESVSIDDDALDLLVQETEGCARDALNLLERVRFSGEHVSRQAMLDILGKISNQFLFDIFDAVVDQKPESVLESLSRHHFEQLNPTTLWDSLVYLLRMLVWVHYNVPCVDPRFGSDQEKLKSFVSRCSISRLQALAQLLWGQEEIFLKTEKKHLFLEMVLIQMCQQVNINDLEQLLASENFGQEPKSSSFQDPGQSRAAISDKAFREKKESFSPKKTSDLDSDRAVDQSKSSVQAVSQKSEEVQENRPWGAFLQQLSQNADPLLNSILAQAKVRSFDEQKSVLQVELNTKSPFFMDKINETKKEWLPLLQKQFIGVTDVLFTATSQTAPARQEPQRMAAPAQQAKAPPAPAAQQRFSQRAVSTPKEQVVSIKDREKWPVANLLVRHFPGTIKQSKVYN